MKIFTHLLFMMIIFSGCYRDDSEPSDPPLAGNDEELITNVSLHFADSIQTSVFTFSDPDGPGGASAMVHDTIVLDAASVYTVTAYIVNEIASPAVILNDEISEEAEDHMLFYIQNGTGIDVTYLDADPAGLPLGLVTRWTTGQSSSGAVNFILKHQPGVKDGTIVPGDTEADIVFRCVVN